MNRLTIIVVLSLTILIGSVAVLYFWIDQGVSNNISIAQKEYPGNAEDALIQFLQDENNSPSDRTHVAVWTLGQIDSEKALPILYEMYNEDPKGITCKDQHDSLVCQYEIFKAIKSIENWRPMSHTRLKTQK